MIPIKKITYPSDDILNPPLRKNYEKIILWILANNNYCTWSNLTKIIPDSTLYDHLNNLKEKGYISHPTRDHYEITPTGREQFEKINKSYYLIQRKLKFPLKAILKKRNYDHWILWMLYNNDYCIWSDFRREPIKINQSSLSKNLKFLTEKEYIIKENKKYRITSKGKDELINILKTYNLDRHSILRKEREQIEKIGKNISKFFYNYGIEDDDLWYRFLMYILKIDYSKVKNTLINDETFYKIVLYLTLNHPNQYPDYISRDEFTSKYKIKRMTLDYFIEIIVEENLFLLKFFKLEVLEDQIYYFYAGGKIEKLLKIIVKAHIERSAYLDKFSKNKSKEETSLNFDIVLNEILKEACKWIFNRSLNIALKELLPNYIKFLVYDIKNNNKLIDKKDKLESLAFEGIIEVIHNYYNNYLKESLEVINEVSY